MAAMGAKRQPDLRKLARRQRWVIWLVLIALLSNFLPYLLGMSPLRGYPEAIFAIGLLVQFGLNILILIGVIMVLVARGSHPAVIVLWGLLMLAPCINLLALVLINGGITRTLRRAGLKVGLMGVDPASIERVLNPALCKNCGYDLTGNVSGCCPECGAVVHWDAVYQSEPRP
jgi:hypothetical protein